MRKIIQLLRLTLLPATLLSALLFSAAVFAAAPDNFPEIIPLPDGFRPEGIVVGKGSDFYVGSLANGAIFKGDLRTGEGSLLYAGATGKVSVGLSFDERSGYLFVAGGGTGVGRVIDTHTGDEIASYTLGAGFINDVVITREAAYFTNSAQAVFYRIPLRQNGQLPDTSVVQILSLIGDWQQVAGFNANGIDATPNGKQLIIVNSTTGTLYLVDPNTGWTDAIDLGGAAVNAGDGILLDGKTLYVVRNQLNQIAVIALSGDLASGQIIDTISDPAFRIPTTVDEFGNRLYAVNARFGTPNANLIEYEVVQVSK